MLRKDGKKLQTRSGENIPLQSMLDEATARARVRLVDTAAKRDLEETDSFLDESSRTIGIGTGFAQDST